MSLKVNLEVAINLHHLRMREFHQIGWVQYRMSLFYRVGTHKKEVLPSLPQIHYLPFTIVQ